MFALLVLAAQLQQASAALSQKLTFLTALQKILAGERNKTRNTISTLALDNQRLTQALELKSLHKDSGSAAEWEDAKREKELFIEWINGEIREGNSVLTALFACHSTEEASVINHELKRRTESLREDEPVAEILRGFSVWKYANAKQIVGEMSEEREAWRDFVHTAVESCKELVQQCEEGNRLELARLKDEVANLDATQDLLTSFKAVKKAEKLALALVTPETSNTEEEVKLTLSKQAEEIQILTQQLAEQRKMDEANASATEKEVSLKNSYIHHLESKVKHLSRKSQTTLKDREIEQLRRERDRAWEELAAVEEQLEAESALTAELRGHLA